MQKLFVTTCFALLMVFGACEKNSSGNNNYLDNADCTGIDAITNTYTNTIKPILDINCAGSGCHDAATRSAGVDLSTYAKAKASFETTECLCSIHHGNGCEPMPQGGGKLSDAAIKLITCWAKNGYLE